MIFVFHDFLHDSKFPSSEKNAYTVINYEPYLLELKTECTASST